MIDCVYVILIIYVFKRFIFEERSLDFFLVVKYI